MTDHPPGTIVITSSTETGRFSSFWRSYAHMLRPKGTIVLDHVSYDISSARNEGFRRAQGEWVFFLDDDHTFHSHMLLDLLSRNVDIIQPVGLRRDPPFLPIALKEQVTTSTFKLMTLDPKLQGLLPVASLGGGCLLVRKRVWQTLPDPWFQPGQLNPGKAQEDVFFSCQARAHGFTPYLDLDHPMGHATAVELWPVRMPNGTWATRLVVGVQHIDIPAARRDAADQNSYFLKMPKVDHAETDPAPRHAQAAEPDRRVGTGARSHRRATGAGKGGARPAARRPKKLQGRHR